MPEYKPPESKPPMASLPPTAGQSRQLHTYRVETHRMRVNSPLTFSDGERIVAVLSSSHAGTYQGQTDIDVTVLVELPSA
jgi:hypothetical protein